ncbi:MAG: pilus assembly protein N-terminal domain-containing protein [Betaproteobacteria bacterium]|nr:pilus assembly protein N-terminal domain-containing protein [Betaproteobacteria bacterium]
MPKPNSCLSVRFLFFVGILIVAFFNNVKANETNNTITISIGEVKEITYPNIKKIVIVDAKLLDIQQDGNARFFLIGKKLGTTTLLIYSNHQVIKLAVEIATNINSIKDRLNNLFPHENKITINTVNDQIVLTGQVSTNNVKDEINVLVTQLYKNKIVNLLKVTNNTEIILEVKVLEIQKNLEKRWGATFTGNNKTNSISTVSNFGTGSLGQFTILKSGMKSIIDAQLSSNNAKILAQPNLISIDGKTASFLAGGKLFIPVPIVTNIGVSSVSLQEENYGVGLKFTPNLLDRNTVLLEINSEVSELAVSSTTYGTGNNLTTIPTIMTRKAHTHIQVNDGDSLIIGGLLQNNESKVVQAFPILSEIPIIGQLFKSEDFQKNNTELIFVVTVHFLKT